MSLSFISSGWTQYVHNQHRKKIYFSAQGISPQKKKTSLGFRGKGRGQSY